MGAIPLLIMGAGLVGGAVKGFGAYESGQAAQASANYQAAVAANNAQIAKWNATNTAQAGNVQMANEGMKVAQRAGTFEADVGASGETMTGSLAASRSAIGKAGLTSEKAISANTANKVYGYETAAQSDTYQSAADIAMGKQAAVAGDITGFGDFLSGGASALGGGYKAGVFGS